MPLLTDLISQFVKVTKSEPEESKESTAYGTTVEYNGSIYVKLDGSDLLTPIVTTADVKSGERVTVMIKDHTATVTGNISSPAARTGDVKDLGNKISEFEIVIADKVSVEQLEAEIARIDSLVADNVTIKERLTASEAEIDTLIADNVVINEKLTAHDASIENLEATKIDAEIVEATYATIESLEATDAKFNNLESTYATIVSLNAQKARIDDLDAKKLSAEQANLKYANIDFTNIGKAAIENFYATSGIIKDLVIGDQTVTGKLVGVTIVGDLIEGGTVKADKLVVLGSDGLYYKLNTDGVSTTTEQTEYNSLNGSIITANTITADKINVKDLVAFDATIGGFNISDNAIYSGAKAAIDNTTNGIYMDKNGQIAVGNGTSYLKYFKDTDGSYKLVISAESMIFSATGKTVDETISDTQTAMSQQNAETIALCNQAIKDALDAYVQDGDYAKFVEAVQEQMANMEATITKNFKTNSEQTKEVGSDLDNRFQELRKYIRFGENGIEIGAGENALKLVLDNNIIYFEQNGVQKSWWDGNDFHIGNIKVDVSKRAQFGNFAFIPRSDGSLMFLKVTDSEEVTS
jgi:hypothetical protein